MTKGMGQLSARALHRTVATAVLVALGWPVWALPATAATAHPVIDYNRDGKADVAFAVGFPQAAVAVGLSGPSGRSWQRLKGSDIVGAQNFGSSAASCDFNGDGYTDLAVGDNTHMTTPGDALTNGGAVTLYYGAAIGLRRGPTLTQNSAGIAGGVEHFDQFGSSLACGRIGSGPYADLVVGAPGEGLGSRYSAGVVYLLFGSSTGVSGTGSVMLSQDTAGIYGGAEAADLFGIDVELGDVTGDGLNEIIIGAVGENNYVGMFHSLRGSSSGWTATGSTYVVGSSIGTRDFGGNLVLGRFDGAGAMDLAAAVDGAREAGALEIFTGSSANLTSTKRKTFSQDTAGVPGTAETGDGFSPIAAGDVTGDGRDDLLVGLPTDRISGIQPGSVVFLRGSSTGLTATGAQLFHQGSAGVPGGNEDADLFGLEAVMADFTGDGRKDAIVGAPQEDLGSSNDAGAATVLPGTSSGLTATGSVSLNATSVGLPIADSFGNFGPR